MTQPWRDDVSKLHKLRVALDSHLPGGWAPPQRAAFVKGFLRKLQSVWYPGGLPGFQPPAAAAGAPAPPPPPDAVLLPPHMGGLLCNC
jgi:hypothetical protein